MNIDVLFNTLSLSQFSEGVIYYQVNCSRFSLDEGQCWHAFKFSDRKIQVTGISAEPGEKATDISIWGWDSTGDQSWMVVTLDFKSILGQQCKDNCNSV